MKRLELLLIAAIITIASLAQDIKPEIIKTGDIAPTFEINTLDGKVFDTKSLEGKVIYLNFFATWCGPCMKELPYVESEIWKVIKHPDFVMLAIAREQKVDAISKFKSEKKYTMPMAADEDRSVYSLFAPQYIPRNIIIDRRGKIIYTEKNFDESSFYKMVALLKNELSKEE